MEDKSKCWGQASQGLGRGWTGTARTVSSADTTQSTIHSDSLGCVCVCGCVEGGATLKGDKGLLPSRVCGVQTINCKHKEIGPFLTMNLQRQESLTTKLDPKINVMT